MTPYAEDLTRRLRRCVDPIRPLAKALGIELVQIPDRKSFPPYVSRFSKSEFGSNGTYGIAVTTRAVYFAPGATHRLRLHEVMHAYLDWPEPLTMVEHGLLLQVERAIAKEIFSPERYGKVVEEQEENYVWWAEGMTLGSVEAYACEDFWKAGYATGRLLGVLDQDDRPTFEAPNWDKRSPHEIAHLLGRINEDAEGQYI